MDQNRRRIQEKFKDLARLADQLSDSLEQASSEHKTFIDMTSSAMDVVNKSTSLLASINIGGGEQLDSASNVSRLKRLCADLETAEIELAESMHRLKQLHLRDSQRIGRVFELSGLVGDQMCRLRERRVHVVSVIHERSCFVDMKLAEIESSLNRFRSWVIRLDPIYIYYYILI